MKLTEVSLVKTAYLPEQLLLYGQPQVAFAGRSNVGKSSLLNQILGRKKLAKVSQTPGKTQSINFFLVNERYHFVDLPGFGYAKAPKTERARWRALVEAYFNKAESLRGLVHLIDIRHEPTALDRELHEWTSTLPLQRLYVLTKADKLSRQKGIQAQAGLRKAFSLGESDVVCFSAMTGSGKPEILNWIAAIFN
ncbi:MAG: ribosome biogenesis GTP-binding protein YihA/YsxC [bacterium]